MPPDPAPLPVAQHPGPRPEDDLPAALAAMARLVHEAQAQADAAAEVAGDSRSVLKRLRREFGRLLNLRPARKRGVLYKHGSFGYRGQEDGQGVHRERLDGPGPGSPPGSGVPDA